ncbi:MAG: DUF4062 domain-containing protein [bacterium]
MAIQAERKYQIFISSSYKDLIEQRKAIIDQTLAMGHIPSGMEMFTAGDEEDLKVIQKAIDQCDIYVVLVGTRFGSVKNTQSFTQIEFRYARQVGKPILAFLLEEKELKEERDKIQTDDPERKYDEVLKGFRKEVIGEEGKRRIIDFFKKGDIGDLKAKFSNALTRLINSPEFKMPGWVRASEELLSLGPITKDPFIRGIIEKLKTFDLLTKRSTTMNPDLKRGMASYFWDRCFAEIIDLGIKDLFFESGSTIAYLSSEFSERLTTPAGQEVISELRIKTNNILTYLELVLTRNIQIELRPYGSPEKRFGATFGDLTRLPEYRTPPEPDPLGKKAKEAVQKMSEHIKEGSKKLLLFATASGLNIDKDSQFPLGPHVGSYYNKLFKRALFTTGCPIVLFIDATKIEEIPFNPQHCFSVCDSEISWESVCNKIPLALCIGAKDESQRERIITQVKQYGFVFIDPVDPTKQEEYSCYPILARNEKYNSILPLVTFQKLKGGKLGSDGIQE